MVNTYIQGKPQYKNQNNLSLRYKDSKDSSFRKQFSLFKNEN